MDAQELKKALQRIADMGPDTSEMSTAHEMAQIASDALAERAVSPAESVQSIDTPEFGLLIAKLEVAATQIDHSQTTAPQYEAAFKALVNHIDASRAAAHAEGRRSAMEELHPQWLKEKERADRAEAKIKADDEAARLMFNDLRKARDEQAQRADAAIAGCKRWCGDGECKDACVNRDVQPSDNLQQASTADVRSAALEDAAAHCDKFGHSHVDAASLAADIRMLKPSENDADPAEDAWLADRLGKLLAGVAVALKGPEPARKRWSYHDLPEIAAKVMLELELHRAKEAAQSTPEGADLPPLDGLLLSQVTTALDIVLRAVEAGDHVEHVEYWGEVKKRLIAATTAAEPVAWVQFAENGNARIWFGKRESAERWAAAGHCDLAKLEPLYRAAPPQQVDPKGGAA